MHRREPSFFLKRKDTERLLSEVSFQLKHSQGRLKIELVKNSNPWLSHCTAHWCAMSNMFIQIHIFLILLYKIATFKKHCDWSNRVHLNSIIHAAYVTRVHCRTRYARNLLQQWFCSLQNLTKTFSGRHYACKFNKNLSYLIQIFDLNIAIAMCWLFYKRNKKNCSSCIVEIYKHLRIFKNSSCFSKHFSHVHKNPQVFM